MIKNKVFISCLLLATLVGLGCATSLKTEKLRSISLGGLRIESSKEKFKIGTSCEIVLPKVKDLDGNKLKCEVTRARFIESTSFYDVGLKFTPPNTDYLKQFVEIINNHYIK